MNNGAENTGAIYEFGKFTLDPDERILLASGESVHLTDKVFDTLVHLICNRGRLVSKDELMTAVWDESFVEEGNLAKNISRLRKILNADGAEMIETLPKRGYRFQANVTEVDGAMLVHRRLRVKVTKTVDDAALPIAATPPLTLSAGPRSSPLLIAGAIAALLSVAGVLYYFLRVANLETGGMVNLTSNLAEDDVPSWSPDGTKITFTSNRDGAGDIYVMNADGSNVTRLTKALGRDASSVWSPDGSKIVFDSDRDGNREIYVMNADGSDQTRLTFDPSSDVGPVSFSPDGKQIAFARNKTDAGVASFYYDIFVMNLDGSDLRQLTTDPEFDAEPAWSPDGSRIHFISARDGNFEIYAIYPDGTGEVNLTRTATTHEGSPRFTADGSQFFCVGGDGPNLNQIYLVDTNDTNRRRITSFTDVIGRLSYSQSARKFALTVKKDGNWEIFSMDAKNLLGPSQ